MSEGARVLALDAAHYEAVAALGTGLFGTSAWSVEELVRDADRDVFRGWVAQREGAVVGYLLAHVVAGEGEVLSVAVDPAARRRGVARALVTEARRAADTWVLEVRADNAAARALYVGMGFSSVDRRRAYYGDGVDALVLRWELER